MKSHEKKSPKFLCSSHRGKASKEAFCIPRYAVIKLHVIKLCFRVTKQAYHRLQNFVDDRHVNARVVDVRAETRQASFVRRQVLQICDLSITR